MKEIIIVVVVAVLALGAWWFYGDQANTDINQASDNVEQTDVQVPEILELVVEIQNVSEDQPLSPGLVIVHDAGLDLNPLGAVAPEGLEALAEVGNPDAYADYVRSLDGVEHVEMINNPIAPGDSLELDVTGREGMAVTVLSMAVASNDGLAYASFQLASGVETSAQNYDAGTEENSDLGSGFDGGQPDPSRGAENLDNGTATDPQAEVSTHEQLTETIMHIKVKNN